MSVAYFLGHRARSVCYGLLLITHLVASTAQAQTNNPKTRIPVEITPEAVLSLQSTGVAYLLVDAQQSQRQTVSADSQIRLIYFTMEPSFRAAQEAVLRDRAAVVPRESSQRLTGTPAEWSGLGLNFPRGMNPKREHPTLISPKSLSEAIKDGVDLQIIDLRPTSLPTPASIAASASNSLPGAVNLLPHQLDAEIPKLSKLRWIVLVDEGNRVAQPIAERMFQQGHTLICILEGGYPAWVSATNR